MAGQKKEAVVVHRNDIPLQRQIFRKIEPYLYLLPAFIFLFAFTYYPFVKNFLLSFFIEEMLEFCSGNMDVDTAIEKIVKRCNDSLDEYFVSN